MMEKKKKLKTFNPTRKKKHTAVRPGNDGKKQRILTIKFLEEKKKRQDTYNIDKCSTFIQGLFAGSLVFTDNDTMITLVRLQSKLL
jgi:hypothetical protein